jgi:hypothetical protein
MTNLDNNLSEIFDCEPVPKHEVTVSQDTNLTIVEKGIDDDFSKARDNISDLIDKGNSAIDNLLHVAKESEHPRAYEVAANFIKTLSELNKDLLDIHKKKNEINGKPANSNESKGPLIDKAVFIGSTNDLINLIREKK